MKLGGNTNSEFLGKNLYLLEISDVDNLSILFKVLVISVFVFSSFPMDYKMLFFVDISVLFVIVFKYP